MNRMHSEQDIKDICKITNGSGDIKVYNSGLQVDTNGDVTVGRDLYIEDEMVIDKLTKIVDTDGEPLFNFGTPTAGDYNLKLVVDATGKCVITIRN